MTQVLIERFGLTAYDAAYLALAQIKDARLATAYRELARAAGRRAILLGDEHVVSEGSAGYEHDVTWPDWRGASVGINDVGLLTAPDCKTYAVAVMIRHTKAPASARHRIMHSVTRAVAAQWATQRDLPADGRQVATSGQMTAGL